MEHIAGGSVLSDVQLGICRFVSCRTALIESGSCCRLKHPVKSSSRRFVSCPIESGNATRVSQPAGQTQHFVLRVVSALDLGPNRNHFGNHVPYFMHH